MEMIEKLEIPVILNGHIVNVGVRGGKFFLYSVESYYPYKEDTTIKCKCTGWFQHGATSASRRWYINGIEAPAMEVFDVLDDEQKLEAIFELDQWK